MRRGSWVVDVRKVVCGVTGFVNYCRLLCLSVWCVGKCQQEVNEERGTFRVSGAMVYGHCCGLVERTVTGFFCDLIYTRKSQGPRRG